MKKKDSLKTYFILLTGQTNSQFGTAMTSFAVIVWIFMQKGNVISSSLLGICSYLPYLIAGFLAGSLSDRMKKKHIMLGTDLIAVLQTLWIIWHYYQGTLNLGILCCANFISGLMNAFQKPAASVAVSLLVPQKYLVNIGGLQSTVSAVINMLTPILASSILGFLGLGMILWFDLITFLIGFLSLFLFVKIPDTPSSNHKQFLFKEFWEGWKYLLSEKGICTLFIAFAGLNFFIALTFDSMMQPLVLARTANNTMAVGIISAAMAVSHLISGLCILFMKPAKKKVNIIFLGVLLAFSGIFCFGLADNLISWTIIVLFGCFGIPFYFSYESALTRSIVPLPFQGRIFAMKEMLSQGMTMFGFLCGAILADYVFEPFMMSSGALPQFLSSFFGTGKGSGIRLLFTLFGIIGFILTVIWKNHPNLKLLNERNL